MGLFGSRTKTQVGTTVSRVMEDNSLPNSIVTGTLMAIQQSDGQMIEHAIEELSGGLGMRIHQLYDYGKVHYTHGLPSGTTMTNLIGRDTIIQAIQSEVGVAIGLDYYHVGPLNLMHLGWHLLVRDYAYNSIDNSLMVNGTKVFLTDMMPVVVEATVTEIESGSMDLWGISPTSGITPLRKVEGTLGHDVDRPVFIVDAAATADHLLVKYCHEVDYIKVVEGVNIPSKRVEEGQFTMSVEGWDMTSSFHQAGYTANNRRGFWLYRVGSWANPAVEEIFETSAEPNGTFFPMTYFRYNKQAITETSPEYATSKKMLKLINMDFDEVATAINDNPDIADVEQAIMTFAVPANTQDQMEQRYLFDFFNNLWTSAQEFDATSLSERDWDIAEKFNTPQPSSAIIIQDTKFKMALTWKTIIKRRVSGETAPEGKYESTQQVKNFNKKALNMLDEEIPVPLSTPLHTYRRQISPNVYEEIQVIGLKMTYYVWGNYTTTGDENDDILLIPLDYAITSEYTIKDRELLYARSMHYVFNSRVVTKLKWYQTGIFKVILLVIAIVITIYTNGAAWESIAAAWSAGGVTAVMAVLVPMMVKYVVISLIVRKVVQVIGIKAALIIAVIAAVTGYYQAMGEGGIANAPWAAELLQVSTNLTSGMSAVLKEEFKELESEFRSFQEFAKDKEEALKAVNASLDGSLHLVPMIIWGESPSDFYQRTVHSGNIGIVGIEAVSSFVDAALTLPKLTDSLGDLYV